MFRALWIYDFIQLTMNTRDKHDLNNKLYNFTKYNDFIKNI